MNRVLPSTVFALSLLFSSSATAEIPEESPSLLTVDSARVSLIQNAVIAAPISGVVGNVDVKEGDQVVRGDRLAQLDSQQAVSELEAAKAAFEAARMESEKNVNKRYAERTLEVHQLELKQSQLANKSFSGAVSTIEIEKLKMVVDQARLAIEQAQYDLLVAGAKAKEKRAAVKISEERLSRHSIQTTVQGLVAEVNVEPGEWVEAGKPLARVISLHPIRVECFVDGRDHGMELVGHTVRFRPEMSNGSRSQKEYVGKVTFVSPELHPVTGQARLWATIDNSTLEIRAGMHGQVVIDAK